MESSQSIPAAETERMMKLQDVVAESDGQTDELAVGGGDHRGNAADDAAVYYAQLVEEESTRTVMTGVREVIERKGLFCALYSDRGSHFFYTHKADDCRVFAAGAWTRRA